MTYLYFIQQGYGAIKIGIADDPGARLAQMQTGNSKELRLLLAVPFEERKVAYDLEQELHASLIEHRIRGEWFNRRIVRHGKLKKLFKGTLKEPEPRADLCVLCRKVVRVSGSDYCFACKTLEGVWQ